MLAVIGKVKKLTIFRNFCPHCKDYGEWDIEIMVFELEESSWTKERRIEKWSFKDYEC